MLSAFKIPVSVESASHSFEHALAGCNHPNIRVRLPDYEGWLGRLWDYNSRNPPGDANLYPTNGRPAIQDPYPAGLEPKQVVASSPVPVTHLPPPPVTHFPLEDKINEILGQAGIKTKNYAYFRVGNGILSDGALAKVYGCLKTNKADAFARELVAFTKSQPVNFEGKFYELGGGAHNNLVLYVPFGNLPHIANWLATKAEYFHQMELSHPAGVQLFPGVSTVISTGGFDMDIFRALTFAKNRADFVAKARQTLENHPELKYHFRWLAGKQKID